MHAHRRGTIVALTAALAGLLLVVGGVAAGGRPFSVSLTGAAEQPGPGDPDASGSAQLRLNPGQGTVCYTLTVTGVEDPAADPPVTLTGAHIHEITMPNGTGPVRVPLAVPTGGSVTGCVANVSRALIRDILVNPEDYYVNVHSTAFPAGAVRGDLSR
jgi:hypothetical protein